MITTNDLIGLQYTWNHRPDDGSGKTDCFQLACEVHRRFGYFDYSPAFEWVYQSYTEATFPRKQMALWLLENGKKVKSPTPATVVMLPGEVGAALGTFVTPSDVLYISPNGNVVRGPIPPNVGKLFWMEQ